MAPVDPPKLVTNPIRQSQPSAYKNIGREPRLEPHNWVSVSTLYTSKTHTLSMRDGGGVAIVSEMTLLSGNVSLYPETLRRGSPFSACD